jgi:hypothetical protein
MAMTEARAAPRAVTGEPELQRSSCELKTSTRGTDISIKVYVGSPVSPAVDEANAQYFRAFDEIEAQLMGRRKSS